MAQRNSPLRRSTAALTALLLGGLSTACTSHSVVSEFHGVNGIRGVETDYMTTTSWALHGLFVLPLTGDARKSTTIERFAAEAGRRGAARQRIVQTSSLTYWFIFPPLSFFIHPVQTTVEGDIEPR